MTRVVMFGCGPRGARIAEAYAMHPESSVAAVYDTDHARRDEMADAFGCEALPNLDWERISELDRPLIGVIATRTARHAPLTILALHYGSTIFDGLVVEKPLASTPAQLSAIRIASHRYNIPVFTQHQGVCTPPFATAKRLLADGIIGDYQHTVVSGKGYSAGYDIINLGTHLLVAAQQFSYATPVRVAAHFRQRDGNLTRVHDIRYGPYDFGLMAGDHIEGRVTGLPIHLDFKQLDAPTADNVRVDLYGDQGILRLYWRQGLHWRRSEEDPWEPQPLDDPKLFDYDYAQYPAGDLWHADATLQSVTSRARHPADLDKESAALHIIWAAAQSHFEHSNELTEVPWDADAFDLHPLAAASRRAHYQPDRLDGALRYSEWATHRPWASWTART